jgi:hypothetical protein
MVGSGTDRLLFNPAGRWHLDGIDQTAKFSTKSTLDTGFPSRQEDIPDLVSQIVFDIGLHHQYYTSPVRLKENSLASNATMVITKQSQESKNPGK